MEGEVSEEGEEKEKSMRLVMKFGGAAVADGGKIKVVADLIKKLKEEEEEEEQEGEKRNGRGDLCNF